jgi:hypothetical protein
VCTSCGLVFCAACDLSSLDFAARHHGTMCLKCEESKNIPTSTARRPSPRQTYPASSVSDKEGNQNTGNANGATRPRSMGEAKLGAAMMLPNCCDGRESSSSKPQHRQPCNYDHAQQELIQDHSSFSSIFYSTRNRDTTFPAPKPDKTNENRVLQEINACTLNISNNLISHASNHYTSKKQQSAEQSSRHTSEAPSQTWQTRSRAASCVANTRPFASFTRSEFDAFFSTVARTADTGIITSEDERRVYDLVARQDLRLARIYAQFRADLDMYAFGTALVSLVRSA